MAERDAFGNESGATPSPIPGPVPAGTPAWTPPPVAPASDNATQAASDATGLSGAPAWTPPPTRPASSGLPPVALSNASANRALGGGRGRGLTTVISVIVAIVIIGIPLKLALNTGKKAINSINSITSVPFSTPTPPTSTHSSKPSTPSGPPVGLAGRSMLSPTALAAVVKQLHGKGKLTELVLHAQYDVAISHSPTQSLTYTRYYDGRTYTTKSPAVGFGELPVLALSKVDTQAPARMLKHTGHSVKNLDHIVLEVNPVTKKLAWLAFYENSEHHYEADAHGRHVVFVR